jgi:hypothetical protein
VVEVALQTCLYWYRVGRESGKTEYGSSLCRYVREGNIYDGVVFAKMEIVRV